MTTWLIGFSGVLLAALFHAWYRVGKAESHYRKICMIGTAITMHHGKANGNAVELSAPAEIPACNIEFVTEIHANDHVCMRVRLEPGVRRRRQEPEVRIDADMAAALA